MSSFQMAILLGFNNSLSLSVKDLQQTTQLPEKELIKQIQSLLDAKLLIMADKNTAENATEGDNQSETTERPLSVKVLIE